MISRQIHRITETTLENKIIVFFSLENFEANRIAKTITKFAITTKLNKTQKTRAISSYVKEALKNAERNHETKDCRHCKNLSLNLNMLKFT